MQTSKLRKLFGMGKEASGRKVYYVHGSGLMPVPADRQNEISKVISEYHSLEAERAIRLAKAKVRVGY